jgi:hypothetical protein
MFLPSAPLDLKKLDDVKVRVGGRALPYTLRAVERRAGFSLFEEEHITTIELFGALPPNLSIAIDPGGLTDIIGRPVSIPAPSALLADTAITDLTFKSAPPRDPWSPRAMTRARSAWPAASCYWAPSSEQSTRGYCSQSE